jgi:hypothetical protein
MEKRHSWETNSRPAAQEIPQYSLPCPQQPAIGLNAKPDERSPDFHRLFFKIHFNITFSSMHKSPKLSLSFRFSDYNLVCTYHLSHVCYTPCPSHLRWYHRNNAWRKMQTTKILILQFPPSSSHFISLLRHDIIFTIFFLEHPQSVFIPSMWDTKFHTHTKQVKLQFYTP